MLLTDVVVVTVAACVLILSIYWGGKATAGLVAVSLIQLGLGGHRY